VTATPDHTIEQVQRVEITRHRWQATIRAIHVDGTTTTLVACAEGEHSGLWLGHPAEHQEA
jgi:hypothetical protein